MLHFSGKSMIFEVMKKSMKTITLKAVSGLKSYTLYDNIENLKNVNGFKILMKITKKIFDFNKSYKKFSLDCSISFTKKNGLMYDNNKKFFSSVNTKEEKILLYIPIWKPQILNNMLIYKLPKMNNEIVYKIFKNK